LKNVLRGALAAALLLRPVASLAVTDPRGDIEAANKRFITALKSADFAAIAGDYEITSSTPQSARSMPI
jgi:hypothetical protein